MQLTLKWFAPYFYCGGNTARRYADSIMIGYTVKAVVLRSPMLVAELRRPAKFPL